MSTSSSSLFSPSGSRLDNIWRCRDLLDKTLKYLCDSWMKLSLGTILFQKMFRIVWLWWLPTDFTVEDIFWCYQNINLFAFNTKAEELSQLSCDANARRVRSNGNVCRLNCHSPVIGLFQWNVRSTQSHHHILGHKAWPWARMTKSKGPPARSKGPDTSSYIYLHHHHREPHYII